MGDGVTTRGGWAFMEANIYSRTLTKTLFRRVPAPRSDHRIDLSITKTAWGLVVTYRTNRRRGSSMRR